MTPVKKNHLAITTPSPWIERFVGIVPIGSRVLDLACGNGRHGKLFLARGCDVTFLDKDPSAVPPAEGVTIMPYDLEDGSPWPFEEGVFDAITVTNYLHRPLFDGIINSLKTGGVLLYETFARGNETFSRPRNPDHLLKSGELLALVNDRLQVIAYEHGRKDVQPTPGVVQRICAVKDLETVEREDGDPPFHPIYPST